MSDNDIDKILEELVQNITIKLDDQQKELNDLKVELLNVKAQLQTSQRAVESYHQEFASGQDLLHNKLIDIATKIDNTNSKIIEAFNKITEIDKRSILKNEQQDVVFELPDLRNELNSLQIQLNEIKLKIVEQKNIPSDSENLTQLPAYLKSDMFKEIRRPVNLNELYMMVLQSQRTINELQMNVDNICRRN